LYALVEGFSGLIRHLANSTNLIFLSEFQQLSIPSSFIKALKSIVFKNSVFILQKQGPSADVGLGLLGKKFGEKTLYSQNEDCTNTVLKTNEF